MKLRLITTAAMVTTLAFAGFAHAAGPVSMPRPMPRPADLGGSKDGPRLNPRGWSGAYGIPKGSGAAVRAGDGSQWQSCPCLKAPADPTHELPF